ncbi:threonine aldolase family protein [Sphingomonas sp. PR090111-T3T-6A]|uniref:threonine aldolase family protein n=1 Tax=Sphingomonas sp. PR090111-T3T-6A TaxID=685778 RepID=UPI0003630BDA|nr:beta-eliminating lyase-related protein [Sphingomonas sp. PR090111-T3T-6A]
MRFFSDNAATVAPAVLEAIAAANRVDTAYDGDWLSQQLDGAFSDLFGTDVAALWVTTGTAANCLALSAMVPPHGGVLCHREAHINTDEAGAPEFFTHGAKLIPLDGGGAKLTPETVRAARRAIRPDVHQVQPRALSITNATEYGLVYTPDEVAALGEVSKDLGLGFHMDGARFANAVARLGCHPGDVTWRAGVDALSFGFVKNGGLSAEALIFFRKDLADVARMRRKRAGQLLSKGRYQAAQLLALIEGDRWIANGRASNAGAAAVAEAAAGRLMLPVEANEIFLRLTADEAASLRAQGFDFYDWGEGQARLVTSWDQPQHEIDALAAAIRAL